VSNPQVDAQDTDAQRALSIDEEYKLLQERVAEKRKREQIVLMRQELAGDTPDSPVVIEGVALPTRKRASTTAQGSATKHIRLSTPPTFSSKSLSELNEFELSWDVRFRAIGVAADDHATRIDTAATALAGAALAYWGRADRAEIKTWPEFLRFLKDTVIDPSNHIGIATLSLIRRRQKDDESVRDLLRSVEDLENEIKIEKMTDDQRKAWAFLNCLKPAIRAEVMREHKVIESREQVVASAQRHEELFKTKEKGQTTQAGSVRGATGPQAPRTSSWYRGPRGSSEKKTEVTKTSSVTNTPASIGGCFKCGQKGHIARNCRNRPERTSVASASPASRSLSVPKESEK